VRYQLAVIHSDQGQLEDARRELESLIKESPQFTEAHVTLSLVYYRLKRPADGKREHDIVEKLTAEAQAKQPGAQMH
jgi:Tfp pilus assembly protein PilF